MKIQKQKTTNHGINKRKVNSKTFSHNKPIKKSKKKSKDGNNRKCLICGKPAVCSKNGCWRLKNGKVDCNQCKERYCEKHWSNIVRKL